MFKKVLFGAALLSLAGAASAQMEATAGYSSMDIENITVGALVASAGFRIPVNETVSLTPGARVGFGITDDTIGGVDFEVDKFYGLQLRAQLDTQGGLYLFALPTYSKAELDASAGGANVGSLESDWEFGIGAGAGFKFTDFVGVEASYEKIDELDVLSVQARFTF